MAYPGALLALRMLLLLPLASSVAAVGPLKFKLWPHNWEVSALNTILTDQCAPQVNDYWTNNSTYAWKCQRALDCILSQTSPSMQQSLSTAIVILGLTPTLLSTLGPNIAESAMLSIEHPVLSLLLSLGAPAVAVTRILNYKDPFCTIESSPNNSKFLPNPTLRRHRGFRWFISSIEYIAALGAIANIVQTSVDLGFRSVSSFDCESLYYPLLWILVPGIIHAISIVSFSLTPKATPKDVGVGDRNGSRPDMLHKSKTIYRAAPTQATLIVQSIATGIAVGHVFFGTMVFSSLLFLTVTDAIPVIMRYAASAVVCRFINQYELALMSEKYEIEQVESPESQGRRFYLFI